MKIMFITEEIICFRSLGSIWLSERMKIYREITKVIKKVKLRKIKYILFLLIKYNEI